jgi:predicted RNA-binding Zn ribbon-like protein
VKELHAKLLANEIELDFNATQEDLREDPNIPKEFFVWAKKQKVNKFQSLMTEKGIFTSRDIARKVHLMHILNMMSTVLTDFFNRNEKTTSLLNDYGIDFYDKDEIISKFEKTAETILKLKLKQKSIWYNKSNSYSLIIALAKLGDEIDYLDIEKLKSNLEQFEQNIPVDFKLASTEGVNNKKERELRNTYVTQILDDSK